MLRPMWTGSISFGLVSIPVKAVTVQSPKDIHFELVHRSCHSRLTVRRYCPHHQRDVPEDEVVRGVRQGRDEFVLIEKDELERLESSASHALIITDFVEMAEVDPIYFEKPYYLQPGRGGEHTYALLHRALSESKRVGIGKVVFRDREHVALVRTLDHALVMETMAFPDEVRYVGEAVAPLEAQVNDRELEMAHYLIEGMAGAFEPGKYRDDYREAVAALIETKAAGGTVRAGAAPSSGPKGEVVDLMEMLRKSVEAAQQGRSKRTSTRAMEKEDESAGPDRKSQPSEVSPRARKAHTHRKAA